MFKNKRLKEVNILDNEYTKKVLDAVSRAKSKVQSAERAFNSEKRSLEYEANYTTFNINNMSKAIDFVARIKRATDELYTDYESIVRFLDMECRPLLAYDVSAAAIKKVADLIKEINRDSSDLRSNITGTFFNDDLGDLRTEQYIASIEAKSIEKFWVNKYETTPEAKEEQKRKAAEMEKRRKLREKQAKEAEERRKKEAEERKRIEKEKAAEEKRIAEANATAKAYMDKCIRDGDDKVADFRKKLQNEIQNQRQLYQKEIDAEISKAQASIAEQQKKLSELGFFKLSEKNEAKKKIKILEMRILKYQNPLIISEEIDKMHKIAEKAISEYRKEIDRYLSRRFSDFNSTQSSKTKLMYVENANMASQPYPSHKDIKKLFE